MCKSVITENSRSLFFRRLVLYCCVCIFFLIVGIQYWNYAMIAKSTVPIMDYWHWTAVYGEDVLNGTISLSDYFFSDVGEHVQPFAMSLQFAVLKASKFDVVPLVTWGIALRIVIAGFLAVVFLWRYREEHGNWQLASAFTAAAIIMSALNYNQWELTIEPFSLTNACRVLLYYLSFLWIDQFVLGFQTRSYQRNMFLGTMLGIYCAFLTIFVGSAYFVGHLPAIGLILVWVLWRHRSQWKAYLGPFAAWCVISFIAACVYYCIFSAGSRGIASTKSKYLLLLVMEGVCMFWGSVFIPQTIHETMGVAPYCVLGAFILFYAVYITIRYLKTEQSESNIFPVICVLYAMIISAMICWGRIGQFGPETMISSRYVVESSIGLFGIIWMSYGVYRESEKTMLSWSKPVIVSLFCLALSFAAAQAEIEIAPYRKAYNENIRNIMLNIDEYSDEELSVTQGNAEDVRYCVDFFKKNNLSIFYNE